MTLQELGTGTILSTEVNHLNKRQFKMSADILPCRYTVCNLHILFRLDVDIEHICELT